MDPQSHTLQSKTQLIIKSCQWVHAHGSSVKIQQQKIDDLLPKLSFDPLNTFFEKYPSSPEKLLEFLFVLDSLNFCFWPLEEFEFINLANGIYKYLEINSSNSLEALKNINAKQLFQNMFGGQEICLAEDRSYILNTLAFVVQTKFQSSFIKIIEKANKSAVKLLQLLTSQFIFFQDHSIYKGHQIHFYKRAQLLIRHIYGAFEGKGLGEFTDVDKITIFPDYRIPQVFHTFGIFKYHESLANKVMNKEEIMSGSQQEIEIRAATVVVAEKIKDLLRSRGKIITSIELDWALWFYGQSHLQQLKPHHRTLTIYY